VSPFIKGLLVGAVVVFAWQHLMGGTGKASAG
jgi:hypothetical protein